MIKLSDKLEGRVLLYFCLLLGCHNKRNWFERAMLENIYADSPCDYNYQIAINKKE